MEPQRVRGGGQLEGARIAYGIFAAMVGLDLVLIGLSADLRNALGRIDGRGGTALLPRVLPDVLLLFFYSWFLSRGFRRHRAVFFVGVHSLVFATLGLAAMIPWLGMFAAFLTPISVVYFGAVLWLPSGYYVALFVALAFAATNVAVGMAARRSAR